MSKIVLVPTPIGNLGDITLRAIETLKQSDLIAAEDTRTTGILLKHYDISTPQIALHQHNEHKRVPQLIEKVIQEDLTLAVVSDAGTPGISDPGFLLVREAIQKYLPVESLPGATALIPALVLSGLPCDRFVFEGFLPLKKGRQTRLKALIEEPRTIILYESPHRIIKTLVQLIEHCGADRAACFCRELTKIHEIAIRGTLQDILSHLEQQTSVKGECVIVVAGK
jgi:16S rRNA (cytidine1402-2'-O)-methyltransferase